MAAHLDQDEKFDNTLTERTGPLKGVRVVDLTQALAGPFCTMLLADLGADVIKVEPPHGDIPRFGGPFTIDDEEHAYGGYFGSINRNKRGVVLDLKDDHGREQLMELLGSADVLVENFRAGVMDRLGLSYETIHERYPKLLYAAIRGFGDPRTGESPYVDWPAFDVVAQAMSGFVSANGEPNTFGLKSGISIGDLYPATMAALGIVAGVFHARESGEGQFLDVAMIDSLLALNEALVYRYSYTGVVTEPLGNSHPQLSPFDIYATADGACAIAAPTQNHWELLCGLIGRPDLVEDERTTTNRERVANAEFVKSVMSGWTTARTTDEVVRVLGGKVPVGPVNDAEALFNDPHVAARKMLVALDQPSNARKVVFPNTPFRFTATPAGVYRRAPKLGEHNEEILTPDITKDSNSQPSSEEK